MPTNGAAQAAATTDDDRSRFLLYGLRIVSTVPLPGARASAHGSAEDDVRVDLLGAPHGSSVGRGVTHHATRVSQPDIAVEPDGIHILDWSGFVQVRIDAGMRSIGLFATADRLPLLPSIVAGWTLGYVLLQRGAVCLHGSVVRFRGRTVALLGDSGAGKSTLAAAAVRAGADLLADDVVAILDPNVRRSVAAGPSSLRLTPATADALGIPEDELQQSDGADKPLWTPARESESPMPPAHLDAIYLLEPSSSHGDGTVSIVGDRLDPGAALLALIRASYPPGMPSLLGADQMAGLGTIARTVPVRPVRHARRWSDLPRLVDAILR